MTAVKADLIYRGGLCCHLVGVERNQDKAFLYSVICMQFIGILLENYRNAARVGKTTKKA